MNQKDLNATLKFIKSKVDSTPEIALVLGSGLSPLADLIENPVSIPYAKIPNFPNSHVVGHANELVVGTLKGKKVVCMKGRFHHYSGHSLQEVTFPIRLFKLMGVKTVILTNAAGGINTSFNAGDLMLITDHINLLGNPLIGENDDSFGPRFPDMSEAYSKKLRETVIASATELKIPLKQGVYLSASGPSYETPAEIKMFRNLGGDAVGMSTVPEVLVARHMSMNVTAISCITNMAAGILDQPLAHSEVTETAEKVKAKFMQLISKVVEMI